MAIKLSRRDVREKAMQVLYAYEISKEPVELLFESVIADTLSESKEYRDFAQSLVYKTLRHIDEADAIIKAHSEHWDFDRIAVIDKVLLRMGVVEFLYFDDIPPKVTINECVEIGKRFSTGHSASFLNGMLDSIYSSLTKDERVNKSGRGLVQ